MSIHKFLKGSWDGLRRGVNGSMASPALAQVATDGLAAAVPQLAAGNSASLVPPAGNAGGVNTGRIIPGSNGKPKIGWNGDEMLGGVADKAKALLPKIIGLAVALIGGFIVLFKVLPWVFRKAKGAVGGKKKVSY